jgi:PKD repeat protein
MRKLYILFALLFGFIALLGQRLTHAEYFVGEIDPGVGNGSALSVSPTDTLDQVYAISVGSFAEGFNKLTVRVKDSTGLWSIGYSKLFYKYPTYIAQNSPSMIAMEYFFDTDPGIGNATPLSFTTSGDTVYQLFSVPVSSLGEGFHRLTTRVKDANGYWSIGATKIFYKMAASATQTYPSVLAMEYFFNTDPGIGNATPLSFITSGDTVYQLFSVPVSSLGDGFHRLTTRVKDANGQWSIGASKIFYKMSSAATQTFPSVVAMEYFIDSDPGIGHATNLNFTTSGDSVYQIFSIPVSNMGAGFHKLSVRAIDANGDYSIAQSKIFYVLENTVLISSSFDYMEYFFDEDPGFGLATSLNISITDTINQVFSVPMTDLDSGLHFITVRGRDSLNIWSNLKTDTFRVLGCNSPMAAFSIPQNICIGDTLTLSNSTTGTDQWINYMWDMNSDGSYEFSSIDDTAYVFTVEGDYDITLKATNSSIFTFGCVDTLVKTVHVRPLPPTNVTAYGSTTFCQGQDVPLSANYGLGYSYQWLKNDTAVTNATNPLYTATEAGNFAVEITTFYGCVDTSNSTAIVVNPLPPATVSTVGSTNICQGTNLTLQANTGSGLSYFWKKNGTTIGGQTGNAITVSEAANYQVEVTNSNGCVNLSAPFGVSVQPVPNAVITTGGITTICQGDLLNFYGPSGAGYSYQWLKNGQSISGANGVYHSITESGSYQVIVSNSSLCTDTSANVSATVNPSPVSQFVANGASIICMGDSVTLDAVGSSGQSYQWKNYGINITSATDSVFFAKQNGNYSLITTNSYNCSTESSAQTIVVNALPGASILPMSSTSFCNGDSVKLQANTGSNFSYQWLKNGQPLTGDTNSLINATNSGSYTVIVENANNCNAISLPAIVNVFAVPSSDFVMDSIICAGDTVIATYTGTGSSGAFYNWNFGGGTIVNGNGQGPFSIVYQGSGVKQVQLSVSENGCVSNLDLKTIQLNSIPANITSVNTSVCQGDSVFLAANSGQNLIYQWIQGGLPISGATLANLTAGQSGNYSVRTTDTLIGCSQMSLPTAVNVFPTNFNLDFSANTTSFTQPPFAVTFTNQTPNINNYQFEWDLGDGNTSTFYHPGHSYQYNGNYTVSLYAENATTGCRDTIIKSNYISCAGGAPNPCNILAAITPAGPVTICGGDSIQLTASAGTGYTYQWVFNNMIISGATSQLFIAKQAGNYRVVVSDAICSQTSPAFVLNHYPSIQPVIQAMGQIQPCTFDSLQLSLFVNYNHYNWSTGDTTSGIYVSQTGYYQVAVTDNYGCNLTSLPYVVNNSFLNPPEICIVGVDSANHNRLVWERQSNNLIDSFYIYREGFIANQYNKIGAIPFSVTSLFVDINSNPAIQSYRYKIAAVDTCGGVTLLSDYHKTIHLTINAGLNGSWNLIWDGYQGFPFSTYRIYRGTNVNNMSLLTQLPSSSTSYTDLNPPSGTVYYQIEVIKNSGCYPDTVLSKANTNYNTSRSNTANNSSIAPIFFTAEFGANILSGQWPIKVEFTDQTVGNPNKWRWDFGDGNSSSEQNPNHTFNNTGLYTVSLIACNGNICDTIQKTDFINVLPNGQVEIGASLIAKVFPNPNDGSFTLELNSTDRQTANLFIYNSLGQLIINEPLEFIGHLQKQLQLTDKPKGVYFINVSTKNGIVFREKVIIQ